MDIVIQTWQGGALADNTIGNPGWQLRLRQAPRVFEKVCQQQTVATLGQMSQTKLHRSSGFDCNCSLACNAEKAALVASAFLLR